MHGCNGLNHSFGPGKGGGVWQMILQRCPAYNIGILSSPGAKGGIKNPYLDERLKPLDLTTQEKADLVAFMKALSGEGWQHVKPPKKFPD